VLTQEVGRHFLKFGGEFRRALEKIDSGFFFVGRFVFDGRYTGDSLADFLVGRGREFNFAGGRTLMHQKNYNLGWFFQDDWTVNDRVTLNLGLRWDFYSPIGRLRADIDVDHSPGGGC
jgi:outer membrane receptor protein involved in Fe transport